ncbi:MAG: glycosyltransferase family 9 protein [Planctomycetota bacterium]|nr:glycosyltransferase family 9 protein [Planctomycetota bacterium]
MDPSQRPRRLLVVMPSWLGDAVMATPTLRRLREGLPGAFIGALCRPGVEVVLEGTGLVDEVHVERGGGMMGPKHAAAKIRPRLYDTALLLTNSFSTALAVRMGGVPRRIGYDRDARGLLLTHAMPPVRDPAIRSRYAPVSAVDSYWSLSAWALEPGRRASELEPARVGATLLPAGTCMELGLTPRDVEGAERVLSHAAAGDGGLAPLAILNPGGNNPAKRWPAERFAKVGAMLVRERGMVVAVNGSPGEVEITRSIVGAIESVIGSGDGARVLDLPSIGINVGTLKALVARAAIMVTNDTGPRHFAAALGTPLVSIFGPTDHRWTIVPTRPGAMEVMLRADPTLPEAEVADEHPERCAVDRITLEQVVEGIDRALGHAGLGEKGPGQASAIGGAAAAPV